ncbi:MAG TPA: helix-turn-helix transcriptional regulator [Candidatus Limnocylindrales bacterium]|nr:helix-turn-helix transcriptional regulator [Candidatus Limnocylindrales bacterium]
MARRSRTQDQIAGAREAAAIAATLGGVARSARRACGWTLHALARQIGVSAARLSEIERGLGARAPLETWISIGVALERPLAVAFSRPLASPLGPIDSGHLQIQEHILGLARSTGRHGTFELPTRPDDPSRSSDVGIRDPQHLSRVLVECWNTFGDLGAAIRSTRRKEHEAAATWPEDRIATVWVVRATGANRALLARFPHIVDAAFPGSSRAWVRTLTVGEPPPPQPGIVWFDAASDRLVERRSRDHPGGDPALPSARDDDVRHPARLDAPGGPPQARCAP